MGIMRNIFLRASRSQRLREILPRFPFVQRAIKRFLPGEEIDDALNAAEELRPQGIASVVTHLGENLSDEREANQVTDHYLDVLKRIQARGLDCHISVKPTQLGLDLGEEVCYKNLEALTKSARELNNFVWIDMESSEYVDRTLRLFKRLRNAYQNVGLCLQSYLCRTERDLQDLLPLAPAIRLVKGAYAEPKHLAFQSKKKVDESYFLLSKELLGLARENGVRVGIATHDPRLVQKVQQEYSRVGMPKESCEFQMLYGIKREEQLRLAREGYRVRVLISYGAFWFPWYMRRLAERPANIWFVLKNVFLK